MKKEQIIKTIREQVKLSFYNESRQLVSGDKKSQINVRSSLFHSSPNLLNLKSMVQDSLNNWA